MLAMPGLRVFSLSGDREVGRVSCSANGVFVGEVPLLEKQSLGGAHAHWTVRSISELNNELTTCYRLPIDIASKANALALIAHAFNRGDFTMAAIAAVQMQLPDPPPLTNGVESANKVLRRAVELRLSGLLKFWDPAKHPRIGTPPNPGWFAPVDEGSEAATLVPAAMVWPPWKKPDILEDGEGGGVPRGTLELPFSGGSLRLSPG